MRNIFVSFVLTFACAGYAFGQCSESDKKALEALDRTWSEALVKGDRNALMAMLADDFTALPGMQTQPLCTESA